jgi:hypothetical protein
MSVTLLEPCAPDLPSLRKRNPCRPQESRLQLRELTMRMHHQLPHELEATARGLPPWTPFVICAAAEADRQSENALAAWRDTLPTASAAVQQERRALKESKELALMPVAGECVFGDEGGGGDSPLLLCCECAYAISGTHTLTRRPLQWLVSARGVAHPARVRHDGACSRPPR